MSANLHKKIISVLEINGYSFKSDKEDEKEDVTFFSKMSLNSAKKDIDEDIDELSEEAVYSEIEQTYIQNLKSTIFSEKIQEELLEYLTAILVNNNKKTKNALIKYLLSYANEKIENEDGEYIPESLNEENKKAFTTMISVFEAIFESEDEAEELNQLAESLTTNINNLKKVNKEKKEYIQYIIDAQNGDKAAVEKIIEYIIPDAENLARKFSSFSKGHYNIYDDLYQEGLMAVLKGINKFSPQRSDNVRLYMKLWLKQSMISFLSTKNDMIKIPMHIKNLSMAIQKVINEYKNNNKEYTYDDIAKELNTKPENIKKLIEVEDISNVSMFSDIMNHGGAQDEEMSMDNFFFIRDDSSNTESNFHRNEEIQELRDVIYNVLNEEERFVLIYRSGFFGVESLLLKDIGEKLGKTEERIRQIEERAREIIAITYFDKKFGKEFREKM